MARAKTAFVVSRLNWRALGGGEWRLRPGTARLAAFAVRDEAEGERARRERNARARLNPFRCGVPPGRLVSMPEDVFRDWVSDTGLSPPKGKRNAAPDWAAWWDDERPAMTAEQLAKLWEGLNAPAFFRIDERPDVPTVFAVMQTVTQDYGDGPFFRDEGGQVSAVYRDRPRAERECRVGGSEGEDRRWLPSGADLFDPETHWRLANAGGPGDVIELELHGAKAATARTLSLVQRLTWSGGDDYLNLNTEERVPVRAFTERAGGEACAAELDAEFRREWDAWPWFAVEWNADDRGGIAEDVRAAAIRLGLTTASHSRENWWRDLAPLPPEQRAALWAAVPDGCAYEVTETRLVG